MKILDRPDPVNPNDPSIPTPPSPMDIDTNIDIHDMGSENCKRMLTLLEENLREGMEEHGVTDIGFRLENGEMLSSDSSISAQTVMGLMVKVEGQAWKEIAEFRLYDEEDDCLYELDLASEALDDVIGMYVFSLQFTPEVEELSDRLLEGITAEDATLSERMVAYEEARAALAGALEPCADLLRPLFSTMFLLQVAQNLEDLTSSGTWDEVGGLIRILIAEMDDLLMIDSRDLEEGSTASMRYNLTVVPLLSILEAVAQQRFTEEYSSQLQGRVDRSREALDELFESMNVDSGSDSE